MCGIMKKKERSQKLNYSYFGKNLLISFLMSLNCHVVGQGFFFFFKKKPALFLQYVILQDESSWFGKVFRLEIFNSVQWPVFKRSFGRRVSFRQGRNSNTAKPRVAGFQVSRGPK